MNSCYHCGDDCVDIDIIRDEKHFCCTGCELVYGMLNAGDLQDYYSKFGNTGLSLKHVEKADFSFLNDIMVSETLIQYSIDSESKVTLYLPQIYCSACIWLLENLNRLNKGIIESKINFLKKEASIRFDNTLITLQGLFELLHSLGYTPLLNLSDTNMKNNGRENRMLWRKVGVAGFAFGNLMLFAMPDYLAGGDIDVFFKSFLGWLNLILSLLVLYAGSGYFISAWNALKVKHINLDFPISLGIFVVFARSVYEILSGAGSGYIDSMAGLVFFLLLGKVFQQKTFHNLSFDRDYKSYFPISVLRLSEGRKESVAVNCIIKGDRLIIRNNEVVPVDSILRTFDKAQIHEFDYSFITGESSPIALKHGDRIYAGARVVGASVEVEVVKKFESGYLIELWNKTISKHSANSRVSRISDTVAKYFTMAVILIALAAFLFWAGSDISKSLNAFTAVLLVACPCALALSLPFTYGTAMRIFAKHNLFVRNDTVVENMASVSHIIFDKTGTLTKAKSSGINYDGRELSEEEKMMVKAGCANSIHPYSRLIALYFENIEDISVDEFNESTGNGYEAKIRNSIVRLGRMEWAAASITTHPEIRTDYKEQFNNHESSIALSINGEFAGLFVVKSEFREFIGVLFGRLEKDYTLSVLSGDSERDRITLEAIIGKDKEILFNKLPDEKVNHVRKLQSEGKRVLMAGDGLNDAGSLQQSDFGLAVSEDIANFTPACDGIILSESLQNLNVFLSVSKFAVTTVKLSIMLSILYNFIGFYFAVQGTLSPVIAAILMPVSSVTVVLFAVGLLGLKAKKLKL